MVRWVRDPAFDGGCCGSCAPKSMVVPPDTELGEQYRDLCGCCKDSEKCKEAGECKCEESNASEAVSTDLSCIWSTQ